VTMHEIHYKLAVSRNSIRSLSTPAREAATSPALPRITKLMALALKLEGLCGETKVLNYTELARLSGVSRSRITQIFNLLNLAPDLQEYLLFLQPSLQRREMIHEPALRRICQIVDWDEQRRQFDAVLKERKRQEQPRRQTTRAGEAFLGSPEPPVVQPYHRRA